MKSRSKEEEAQTEKRENAITGKKAARGRASAEKKAVEMSTEVMDEYVRIKADQGIDAALAFLRKKGFKGPIF